MEQMRKRHADYRAALEAAYACLDDARRELRNGGNPRWAAYCRLALAHDTVASYERQAEQYAGGVARTGAALAKMEAGTYQPGRLGADGRGIAA